MEKVMRSSRRLRRMTGALALVLCLSLLLGACGSGASSDVPELIEPAGVKDELVYAEYGDVFSLSYELGAILPESVEVKFPVDGTLGSMDVIVGQQVKKGDVLFHLDLEQMQEQLDDLTEQLETAQASAEMTNTRLLLAYQQRKEEMAQLEASGANAYAIELKDIDVWEAWQEIEHAEQTQELEQRRLKNEVARLQEEMSEYGQILAPFDGVVSWVSADAVDGNSFTEDTPMLAVSKPDELFISTNRVMDSFLKKCDRIYARIGDAEYELTVRENDKEQDSVDTLNNLVLTSKFDFVGNVKLDLDEVTNAMVLFRYNYRENVLYVPTDALHPDVTNEDKYYVYRYENGERVRVDVEIGEQTAIRTEIISGLKEGDAVYVNN